MTYDAWRVNGGPTQHAPNSTAVTADVLEVGFIFAFCILAFSFALIVPGYRGWTVSAYIVLSVFIFIFVYETNVCDCFPNFSLYLLFQPKHL